MIRNFFRIVSRNFLKNKGFTIINVIGLSVGLAATLLILLWIEDEYSFEKFNKNAGELFRVEEDQFYSGSRYHVTVTPHVAGPVWKQKIPEIEDLARIYQWMPRLLFRKDDKVFFETSTGAVDSSFFRMFPFKFVSGDPETALNSPHSIVLTEKIANKYFDRDNPIGSILTVENKYEFTVTGVIKDLPSNTMFTFKALIPYSFLQETGQMDTGWGSNSTFTFALVKNGSDLKAVGKKLTDIVLENDPQVATKFSLFPLLDIHLHGQFGFKETRGPVIVVTIFTLIAIFVLLLACINFINLSTAKALGRAREIGIKKAAGADQKSLIIQFLLESMVLVAFSMIVALLLVDFRCDYCWSGGRTGFRNLPGNIPFFLQTGIGSER
jgi:putative ABC transport system permease protein